MKGNLARRFEMISVAVLVAGLVPAAQAATCTPASVAGNWGYTYSGNLLLTSGPVPVAATGRYTLDADGNISGTQTRTVAGASAQEVIKGSGTVNSDCTSTATIGIYDGSGILLRTGVLAEVFVNNGKQGHAIFESLVLADGTNVPVVITAEANKQ